MFFVINLADEVVGLARTNTPIANQRFIEAEADIDHSDLVNYLLLDGVVVRNPALVLLNAKAARVSGIKREAATLIQATDWKLAKVKEQELAGWATLRDVDAVLVEREAIRQSSNTAETALQALTDLMSVNSFTWQVNAVIAPPQRVTRAEFLARFTDAEVQGVIAAAQANAALGAWWERFKLVGYVSLADSDTIAGVNALGIAGLLTTARVDEVLAS